MEYEQLFAKALQGRSVNGAAKEWGVPQKTLQQYSKGRVPDYQTALILSREAQVPAGEVMAIIARLEARKKPRSLFPDLGYQAAALMISVNLFLSPTDANAMQNNALSKQTGPNTLHYVKLASLIRRLRKLRSRMLARGRLAPPPAAA